MYNYKLYYGWYDISSCYIYQNEDIRNFEYDINYLINKYIKTHTTRSQFITVEDILTLVDKYLPELGYTTIEFEETFSINTCSILENYDIDNYFKYLDKDIKEFIINHNDLIKDDRLK